MAAWRHFLGLATLMSLVWAQSLQELAERKMRITDSLNRLAAMGIPIGPPPGTPMPLTLAESDCQNAINVCQQTYTYTSSPPNYGQVQELGNNTCLLNREQKTAWFIFTVQSSGTFGFIINTTYDYDFALFDYGAIGGCGGTSTATPIRCNYSAQYGNTGLDASNPQSGSLQWNASQPPIMPGLNVTAGQTFVLVVDNWTRDATGFTITFQGTAQIFDNTPPAIQSVSCTGNPNQLLVTFNELIRCNSIHPTDFNLGGSVTVTAATGVGCGTYTNQVLITFSGTLNSGTRTLTIQTGTDGNTIQDKCGNQIAPNTTFNFPYLGPLTVSASPTSICAGSSSTLTVTAPGGIPAGATISWSNSATTASTTVTPSATSTYTVNVTFGGCTRTGQVTVTLNPSPVISASPTTAVICSGTALITGTTNIPGGQWQYNSGSGWTNTANPMNLPPGTHQIRYQSPDGCWSNVVSVTVSTAPPPTTSACNVIYVTPTGASNAAGTKANPTNLQEALTRASCSNTIIKMAIGDYTINAPITNITSNITLEGGFDAANNWRKTSQAGATRILRTSANVEGCADNAPRLVALEISNAANFRLQDLTIEVQNAPAASASCASGRGVSTYALYLNNCSNYRIVRCRFIAGNGSNGLAGANGSGYRSDGSPGSGGAGGTGSMTGCDGCGGNGSAGTAASTGAAGGAGGDGCCGSGCNIFGCNASGCTGCNGSPGQNGANGTNGSVAATPTPGVWFSPVQSPPGSPGGHGGGGGGGGGGDRGTCCASTCHSGGTCGGSGGNGGRGGNPGQGGWGGGSSFCIYLYQNGGGGVFIDLEFNTPVAGSGGAGGLGANGQPGGAPGARCVHGCAGTPCQRGCCGGDCGAGGNGGWGGNGGNGGNGGAGHNGIAARIQFVSGTAPTLTQGGSNATINLGSNNPTSFALSSQPIITVADVACTNTDVNFSAGSSAAWNFGAGATPATATALSQDVQYSSTGRKTITYSGNTYTEFWNILIGNQTPTITASATSVCPGTTINFTTDLTGINYQWQLSNNASFTNIIASASTQNWNYTFNTAGTYYVRHRRFTDCCGWSAYSTTITITVHPTPAAPTASGTSPVCRGASLVYTATAPAGVTFQWYDAATGGNLVGTGSTITIPFTSGPANWPNNYNSAGSYTLYVESVSAQGCRSSRTPVTINVNQIPAPTASGVSRCGPGQVVLTASYSGPGTPTYNWWDAATGGTLLQSGGSNTYIATVTANTTFWVSVVVPGCVESPRTAINVTVTAAPSTDTWTGAVNTDWFNGGNWQSGCVPNCGTSVTIPAAPANQPVINFNLVPAACNDITIDAGASLTFADPSAELQVCGHFNHNGNLNMTAGGKVRFIGAGVQNYTRTLTATGNFYQVIIDKGAAPLASRRVEVTTTSLPMVITNQLHFISGRIGTAATNYVEVTNSNPVSISGYGVDNYVMGRLVRSIQTTGGLYAFPVGDRHESENASNKGYQLAEVNFTAGNGGITQLLAFFTPTPVSVPTLSEITCGTNYVCALDNGIWTIQAFQGIGSPTYNLALYSRNYSTCTGHPYYSIYKDAGLGWLLEGVCASPSTITQTRRNQFTGFSNFVVVGSSTPLPIASLMLTAQAGASGIALEWRPDREDDVTSYTLLRSTDLSRFEPITTTVADGGPYRYLDTDVRAGQLYYYVAVAQGSDGRERLRSNIAQAMLSAEVAQFAAAIQPNPTRNGSALLLSLPEADSLEIRVYNAIGQLVWHHRGYYEAGPYRQPIPSGEWARGLYAVELRGQRYTWSGKLIRE